MGKGSEKWGPCSETPLAPFIEVGKNKPLLLLPLNKLWASLVIQSCQAKRFSLASELRISFLEGKVEHEPHGAAQDTVTQGGRYICAKAAAA